MRFKQNLGDRPVNELSVGMLIKSICSIFASWHQIKGSSKFLVLPGLVGSISLWSFIWVELFSVILALVILVKTA